MEIGPMKTFVLALLALGVGVSNADVIVPSGGTVEAKVLVGKLLLEELKQNWESLTNLLTPHTFGTCTLTDVSRELQELVTSTQSASQMMMTRLSTHVPKFAQNQWRVYYPEMIENCDKIDKWISGLPPLPCSSGVVEKLVVRFNELKASVDLLLSLFDALTKILDAETDYRVAFYTNYQTVMKLLVGNLRGTKDHKTIVCAVSGYGPSPAFGKIVQSILEFLLQTHPTVIEYEQTTVTSYLTTQASTLNPIIQDTGVDSQTAVNLARELQRKCTDPDFKESNFIQLFVLNAQLRTYGSLMFKLNQENLIDPEDEKDAVFSMLIRSLETRWTIVKRETSAVLSRCTLMTSVGEKEEDDEDC